MAKNFKEGDLVFITSAGQHFLGRNKAAFNINVSGRLAKVLEIYDWKSDRGKEILSRRKKEHPEVWADKKSKDYKYVITIFYPELSKDNIEGLAVPELFTEFHPHAEGKVPLFKKWDPELLEEALGDILK